MRRTRRPTQPAPSRTGTHGTDAPTSRGGCWLLATTQDGDVPLFLRTLHGNSADVCSLADAVATLQTQFVASEDEDAALVVADNGFDQRARQCADDAGAGGDRHAVDQAGTRDLHGGQGGHRSRRRRRAGRPLGGAGLAGVPSVAAARRRALAGGAHGPGRAARSGQHGASGPQGAGALDQSPLASEQPSLCTLGSLIFDGNSNYPGPLGQVVIGRGGAPTMAWQSVARMGIPCLRRVEM